MRGTGWRAWDEALRPLRSIRKRSRSLSRSSARVIHRSSWEPLANEEALALLYASSGNHAGASDYATRALTLAQKETSGPADVRRGHLAKALYILACVQLKSNDRASAHETASKAAATWRMIQRIRAFSACIGKKCRRPALS